MECDSDYYLYHPPTFTVCVVLITCWETLVAFFLDHLTKDHRVIENPFLDTVPYLLWVIQVINILDQTNESSTRLAPLFPHLCCDRRLNHFHSKQNST